MGERTVPILPCPDIPEIVGFYEALGFHIDHLQSRPNPFASVSYEDGFQLQFFGTRSVVPQESMSTCYVLTDRVDELYEAFRTGLKTAYGRIPTRGLPRLGQLKDTSYGVRQFLLTDTGGNTVRVGQPNGESLHHAPPPAEKFARGLHNAWQLGVSKGSAAQGAKVLDRTLSHATPASRSERLRALILRADLAVQLDDPELAARMLSEATRDEDALTSKERSALADDLVRAADLRETLQERHG